MAAHKLTVGQINAAIAAKRKQDLGDGHGLVLRVAASGSAQWIGRYTVKNGKRVEMGLGGYPTVDLKAAREKSAEARRLALGGKNPTVERDKRRLNEMRAGKFFAEVAEEFIALREIEWKHGPCQAPHWRSQLARYAYPFLKLPVAAVDTGLVLTTLEPIWKSKTGVAKALRGRIEQVLAYATHKGYRRADHVNPAQWKRHLEFSLPDPKRFRPVENSRSLDYREIGPFMLEVRRRPGVSARALDFLVLCGSRTSEVSQMTWPELDEGGGIWTLPARVKGRREGDGRRDHQLPLSRQARQILAEMKEVEHYNGHFVFPGSVRGPGDRLGRSISDWAMLQLIKRMGYHKETVTHGLRSTLNSWALDRGVPREPRRMMLSHLVGDQVEEAYRTTEMIERRRRYNQQWADFVDKQVEVARSKEADEAAE